MTYVIGELAAAERLTGIHFGSIISTMKMI
jgi:hypothetical protein